MGTSVEKLINKYLRGATLQDALNFMQSHNIASSSVPEDISSFILKFIQKAPLSDYDFAKLQMSLVRLEQRNPHEYDAFVGVLNNLAYDIYSEYTSQIKKLTKEIDHQLETNGQLQFPMVNRLEEYTGLLNVYRLTRNGLKPKKTLGEIFPGIESYSELTFNVPFALNTLMLTNQLPKDETYCGINLHEPVYPKNGANPNKVPLRRGIKDSNLYFPYKKVNKLFRGDVPDNTYVATNGQKVLYIRGNMVAENNALSPHSIFSSKVASYINKDIFSSERMLDRKIEASRKLNSYNVSVVDQAIRMPRKDYVEGKKKVFPGTGTIDEVLNFIIETDPNNENYGLSSKVMEEATISKIDFNRCYIQSPITKEGYEKDTLSSFPMGIYHGLAHVKQDPGYIHEKLMARLKLSLMSDKLLEAIAEKAYSDPERMKEDLNVVTARTDIALALFLEHKQAKAFLERNPQVLESLYNESIQHVQKHFDNPALIEASLKQRLLNVGKQLNRHFGLGLSLPGPEGARHPAPPKPVVEEYETITLPRPSSIPPKANHSDSRPAPQVVPKAPPLMRQKGDDGITQEKNVRLSEESNQVPKRKK